MPDDFDWRPLISSTARDNSRRVEPHAATEPSAVRARVIEAAKIAWAARMHESLAEPEHDLAILGDIDEFLTALRNSGIGVKDAAAKDEFLRVVAESLKG